MGLEPRVNTLLRAAATPAEQRTLVEGASRLVASPGMGTAYKVFAVAHADLGPHGLAGLAPAPLLAELPREEEAAADATPGGVEGP